MTHHPPTGEDLPTTWILINTFRRNNQLRQLLEALEPQVAAHDCGVIVVDNAPSPEARSVVDEALLAVKYLHQPRPGIATARNTGLSALPTTAQAVIFIDDDELPTPGWLAALRDAAAISGADAVAGPVLPIFPDGEPSWLSTYGYVRRTDFPTGPHARRLATNNTLVKAEWFLQQGYRFDEAFNFSGGEDSDLFERMMRENAQFYWCADAIMTEEVPVQRASQEWLRTRAQRGGIVRVRKAQRREQIARTLPPRALPQGTKTTTAKLHAQLTAEALGRMIYGSLRRFRRRIAGSPITFIDDYFLCEGLGMLQELWGTSVGEYQR